MKKDILPWALLLMVSGCRSPVPSQVHVTPLPEPAMVSTRNETPSDFDAEPLKAQGLIGRGLFEQKSSNSCLFCHGENGKGGIGNSGVDLSRPTTWKVYSALGGDAAYQRDRATFVVRMKIATVALIRDGAIIHNDRFAESWFNWNAPGVTPYNSKMLGLHGSASREWISHFEHVGMTSDIAAEAAWIHLATFDSQGIFAERAR